MGQGQQNTVKAVECSKNTCLEHSMGKQVDSIMVGCERGTLKRLGH